MAVNIAQRVSLIAADVMTVVVTVYHTYGTIKTSKEVGIQTTFSSTLLRSGSLYHPV